MKNTDQTDNRQDLMVHERIIKAIHVIRDHKVLLDSELAEMYGVDTKVMNQAVKRNLTRFPEDFMFQLSAEEWQNLQMHGATADDAGSLRSHFVTLEKGRGKHRKYLPYAFTEQGVAMLSSVLNSPAAIQVNISIMRVFVKMRQWASNYEDLLTKINDLNAKQGEQSEHKYP